MKTKSFYPIVHMAIDLQKAGLGLVSPSCTQFLPKNIEAYSSKLEILDVPTIIVGWDEYGTNDLMSVADPDTSALQPQEEADKFMISFARKNILSFKAKCSAMTNARLGELLAMWGATDVICTGIFTEQCIAQTVGDIFENTDMRCHVPVDLVGYQMINLVDGTKRKWYAEYGTPKFLSYNRAILDYRMTTDYEFDRNRFTVATGEEILSWTGQFLGSCTRPQKQNAASNGQITIAMPIPA